jgi:hypothetical protein
MLFVAGCAKPPAAHGPPLMLAPADPAGEVQTRLLQDARAQFAEGRYETATRLLRRLIDRYPRSPVLLDARWWLARSYEQTGELEAALDQYRLVAWSAGDPGLARQAAGRIAELEPLAATLSRSNRTAILIPIVRLPSDPNLEGWLRNLARSGITTVVLELDRNRDADVQATGRLTSPAHRLGLSVFAGISPRRMMAQKQDPAWHDIAYDPIQRQLRPSESLDLFHPSVQQDLVDLSSALAAAGVDGILFRADAPGPLEGFGLSAMQAFERDFSAKLEPGRLYAASDQHVPFPNDQAPARQDAANQPVFQAYTPEFWRWAGWKSRETPKVLDRIRRTVQARWPALRFMLEVHPETVTDPVQALIRYSEDLLEAKQRRFNSYLFGMSDDPSRTFSSHPGLLSRAVEVIGEANRVWIAIPLPAGELDRVAERVRPDVDRASLPRGIGVMYGPESGSVP